MECRFIEEIFNAKTEDQGTYRNIASSSSSCYAFVSMLSNRKVECSYQKRFRAKMFLHHLK